jgi:hypothetical protein
VNNYRLVRAVGPIGNDSEAGLSTFQCQDRGPLANCGLLGYPLHSLQMSTVRRPMDQSARAARSGFVILGIDNHKQSIILPCLMSVEKPLCCRD